MKSACGGVAFQRVHRAADTANDFLVAWVRLEVEACLIERLQQLVRALEEARAPPRIPIVGKTAHAFTSSRWYAVPLFSCTMRNFCVSPNRLSAWPTKR